jgi:hypothetical protein
LLLESNTQEMRVGGEKISFIQKPHRDKLGRAIVSESYLRELRYVKEFLMRRKRK